MNFDRRRFLGLSAALTASPLLLGQEKELKPEPTGPFRPDTLFLTWFRDPTTTMVIQWAGPAVEAPVRYRNRGSSEWTLAEVKAKPFPVVELPKSSAKVWVPPFEAGRTETAPRPKGPYLPTGPTDYKVHRCELTGLTPGTEYEFILGTESGLFRFRTMPGKATKAFSFISGGDCGTNSHAVLNNKIAAGQDPMFALVAGDLGYDNGINGETALQFLRNWSSTMIDTEGRMVPMVTCIGNHEVRGSYGKTLKEATFFTPFFDGLYEQSYATLDFGNYLSLVLLDTGHCAPIKGAQTAWLDKTLKDRRGLPHLIGVNHVPAYPSYREPGTTAVKLGTGDEQRKYWCPLFEKHQVDVVLEHHDHTFKRTRPLKDGRVDEKTGIIYLGDGSWGRLRIPKTPEKRSYLDEVSTNYHITLHRLEGEQRYHLAFGETGKVLDIFRTGKRRS